MHVRCGFASGLRVVMAVLLVTVLITPEIALAVPTAPRVAPMSQPPGGEVPGQLIVTFEPGVTAAEEKELVVGHNGSMVDAMPDKDTRLVQVDPARVETLARELEGEGDVARVEKNHLVGALAFPEDAPPNDSFYSYQWNFGQVNVPEAWKTANGAGTIVAVIDTGVAYEDYSDTLGTYVKLPDLAGTSFAPGYDFVNDDTHPNDDHGHGSHVAGTIAQTTDNSASEAGLAYGATIMPVKVLSDSGSGTTFDVAEGIRWAADNGAGVINMSLGSSYASSTMQEAVNYATGRGVVVVAAAGNSNTSSPFYPASHDGVISVGAVRYDRSRSYYSNYGPMLDVVAPGGDTSIDQNGDGYGDGILQQTFWGDPADYGDYFFQGTSMASPHVAAVSALLLQKGLGANEVASVLQESAVDLGTPGRDDTFGHGELDAAGALALVQGPTGATLRAPNYASDAGKTTVVPLTWSAADAGHGVTGYDVQYMDRNTSNPAWKTWKSAVVATTGLFPGRAGHTYRFRARGVDSFGNRGAWSAERTSRVPFDNVSLSSQVGFARVSAGTSNEYYLGTVLYSRRAGASVSFTRHTKRFTVVGTGGGHRSNAKVYIDGRYIAVFDSSRRSGWHKPLYSYAWRKVGRHTIRVENLATPGRPQLDIDGLASEQ